MKPDEILTVSRNVKMLINDIRNAANDIEKYDEECTHCNELNVILERVESLEKLADGIALNVVDVLDLEKSRLIPYDID